jgi:hypothetical protein
MAAVFSLPRLKAVQAAVHYLGATSAKRGYPSRAMQLTETDDVQEVNEVAAQGESRMILDGMAQEALSNALQGIKACTVRTRRIR